MDRNLAVPNFYHYEKAEKYDVDNQKLKSDRVTANLELSTYLDRKTISRGDRFCYYIKQHQVAGIKSFDINP